MGLVEGIGSELFPVLPDLVQHLLVMAVLLTAFIEERFQLVHLVDLLLTHRLAQGIALATGETCQLTRQQHDLLLINGNAVGLLQVFLHAGDVILDGLPTLLAVDELGNVVHGARAVEGIHGNQVFETGGMQLDEILLHACRLKLESARCLSLAIQFIRLGVVDGDILDIDVHAMVKFDIGQSLLDDREVFQAQEVHLDQASAFNHAALVLCDDDALTITVGSRAHRNPVGNIVAADDHAARVYTRVADTALQLLGKTDGFTHSRVLVVEFGTEVVEAFQAILDRNLIFLAVLVVGHLIGR